MGQLMKMMIKKMWRGYQFHMGILGIKTFSVNGTLDFILSVTNNRWCKREDNVGEVTGNWYPYAFLNSNAAVPLWRGDQQTNAPKLELNQEIIFFVSYVRNIFRNGGHTPQRTAPWKRERAWTQRALIAGCPHFAHTSFQGRIPRPYFNFWKWHWTFRLIAGDSQGA